MSFSDENIALFDRYLKGEQSSEEKVETELRLISDAALKESFKQYKMSVDTVKAYGIGKEIGDIIDEGYRRSKQKTWLMATASAVVLMITLPAVYLKYFQSNSSQDLYVAYYSPYPADQNVRGVEQTNEAMDLYRTEKYAEAIPLFEAMITSGNKNKSIHLLLGSCYLNVNNPSKAVEHLEVSSKAESKILTQNSEWYLALAYLKQDDTKKAADQLEYIATQNHLFREKAKKILLELQ